MIQEFMPDPITERQRRFYSQHFDSDSHKILILGSSHVGQLNTTLVNEIISQRHPNYVVYNLASAGDTPQKRLKSISQIISLKPDMILYGVSYRDFDISSADYPLPDLKKITSDFINRLNQGQVFPENPRLTSTYVIRDIFEHFGLYDKSEQLIFPHSPFFIYEKTSIHAQYAHRTCPCLSRWRYRRDALVRTSR